MIEIHSWKMVPFKRGKMLKIEHCDKRAKERARERRFPSSLNTGLGQKLEF